MLQHIRERSQGIIASVIIGLVCFTFIFWGVHSYLSTGGTNNVVATVNGTNITSQLMAEAYERLRIQQQMQLGADWALNPQVEIQLKTRALNQLVLSTLLSQAAEKQGFRITERQIDTTLANMPAFQINGQFSRERFQEILAATLYTEPAFLSALGKDLIISQVQSGYTNTNFALPNEVNKIIQLVGQKRDIGYFIIPKELFLKNTHISETQALAFYNQHKDQFLSPEQVSVDYLELSVPQLAKDLHFTPAEVQQFYKENIDTYTQPKRWHVARILFRLPPDVTPQQTNAIESKANLLLQRLHNGENFEKLTQQFSEDNTAKQGGDIGWIVQGSLPPDLEKAINALKPGQYSPLVRSNDGFNIIKLIETQDGKILPFDQVKAKAEQALATQKAQQLFSEKADKLSNLTYANPTTLDIAAKALDLPIQHTPFFSRQGGKEGISANPKVGIAAFNPDVLVRGNNSDAIEINPETIIVIRVANHQPIAPLPYASVKDQIILGLKTKAAQQTALTRGLSWLQAIHDGKDPATIAMSNNLKWENKDGVGRFDSKFNSAILAFAFRIPRPDSKHPVSAAGMLLPSGDYAVITVRGVHDGSEQSFGNFAKQESHIYQEQLENDYGQLDYQFYVQGLLKNAKVTIKRLPER